MKLVSYQSGTNNIYIKQLSEIETQSIYFNSVLHMAIADCLPEYKNATSPTRSDVTSVCFRKYSFAPA